MGLSEIQLFPILAPLPLSQGAWERQLFSVPATLLHPGESPPGLLSKRGSEDQFTEEEMCWGHTCNGEPVRNAASQASPRPGGSECVFTSTDPQAESSLRSTVTEHLAPAGRSRTRGGGEITQCTGLSPAPPLPHSPPHCLSHPSAGVGKALSAPSFPQKPSCEATNMSCLCLSAALLVLLGTLVAGTPGGETSNQAQGKS